MIKYQLKCQACAHQFEGWFVDSAGYDKQAKAGEVHCPLCDSADTTKAIMAPNIARRRGADDSFQSAADTGKQIRSAIKEIHRELAASSDNVGEAFPEEARKIHYGEVEERAIHGKATLDEAKELVDEGIDVVPVPDLPKTDA